MKEANNNTLRRWIIREYPEIKVEESGIFDEKLILGVGESKEQIIVKDNQLYTDSGIRYNYNLSDTVKINQVVTEFFWSNIIKPKELGRSRKTYQEFLEDTELDLEIDPFDALPCSCRKFVINGIDADIDDFGDNRDFNQEIACPYGCGDHRFEAYSEPKPEVLERYMITREEYDIVCDELTDKLYVGRCGWCE